VSTHDLAALPQLASEVVLLFRRVVASGPPDKVLTPENLAVAFGMRPGGEG
jgi:manganese transport system ATP-binding protein